MKYTWSNHCKLTFILIITILSALQCKTQSQNPSNTSSRQLDSLLQNCAYQALHNPITGTIYNANVPSNLTGIKLSVLRLRSRSLKFRGVKFYKEFHIPSGTITRPYVKRVALVYQNLGNWSSIYYPLLHYSYLTPIVGLLAYNAMNLSATNLKELDIIATKSPISVKFTKVSSVKKGVAPKCVLFDLNGTYEFRDLVSSTTCLINGQGHLAIVANITMHAPSPSPSPNVHPSGKERQIKWSSWKIVVILVCAFIGLVLSYFVCLCICSGRKNRKVKRMEKISYISEPLQVARIGEAQAPVASVTRTLPTLEHEYVWKS